MPRIQTEFEQEDGWSRWIPPLMHKYRIGCCDCGLVHDMEFQVVPVKKNMAGGMFEYGEPLNSKKFRVLFRARRNNRSTAAVRRKPHVATLNK